MMKSAEKGVEADAVGKVAYRVLEEEEQAKHAAETPAAPAEEEKK